MNQKPSFDITRGEWDPDLLSEYGSLMQTGIYYEFLDPIWHLLYEQVPPGGAPYPPPPQPRRPTLPPDVGGVPPLPPPPNTAMDPTGANTGAPIAPPVAPPTGGTPSIPAAGGPPIGPPDTMPQPDPYGGGDAGPFPMGEEEENAGDMMPPPNQDPMMMGGEANMMGGSEFEDPEEQRRKSLSYMFELRKIYTKLVELESLIDTTQFAQIRYLKDMITEAIQLLTIVSLNFTTYMNRMPLIIAEFYRFITYASKLVLFFYQKKEEKDKEESKENYQKKELYKKENKVPDPTEFNVSATFPMEGT